MPTKTTTTYSAISTFRNCRQKYKHRYIDLIEKDREPPAALWIGSLVHDCLEMYHRGQPLGEVLDFIHDKRVDSDTKNWIQCAAIMTAYARKYPHEDQFKIITLEDEFCGPLVNPSTGHRSTTMEIAGKVDGLIQYPDGNYAIFEHKTTSEDLEKYTKNLWSDFQTRFYCVEYGRYKGLNLRQALFNLIKKSALRGRKGESDEQLIERMTEDIQFKRYLLSFDPALMEEIGEQVWELKDNMQQASNKDKYYKNESQCKHAFGGFCDYYDLCSSGMNPIVRHSLYRKRKGAHTELTKKETNATHQNHPA
jgi:hypothetical protein